MDTPSNPLYGSVKPREANEQRGTALIEFILVAPFLITILVGLVDMSSALREYFHLRDAVSAGAEYAMSASPLPQNTTFVSGSCTGNYDPVHAQVHSRVEQHIDLLNRSLSDPCFQSKLILSSPDPDDAGLANYSVRVSVSARYEAMFPLFDGIRISAEARVPYLLTPPGGAPWSLARGN